MTTDVTKHVNKNNSDHSILFEAINLVLKYDNHFPEEITKVTIDLLSKFIAVKEPNIRCLALEALTKTKPHHINDQKIKENLPLLLQGLKEPDLSIRRRCLDTLFQQCNYEISGEIINELLDHL